MLTGHTTDGQLHSIGKAIRPFFADPVTQFCSDLKQPLGKNLSDNMLRMTTAP